MTDKNKDESLPKVSKAFTDLEPAQVDADKVKGGAINSIDGGTMGGGTTTTGDNTIPM